MNIRQLSSKVAAQNKDFIQQFHQVALAVSGGVDSTALFHVFLEWAKNKKNFDLRLLHVNFGLRGEESDGDEAFVRELAMRHSLTLDVLEGCNLKKRLKGESTQVWARRIRHEWFQEYAKNGYKIALGHNESDLAENVLLRLARGSEPENLAGMGQVDGFIWRPLLGVPRSDIEQAMRGSKILWREDSSNSQRFYTRNVLRHEVFAVLEKLYPGASGRIARLGRTLNAVQDSASRGFKQLAGENLSKEKILAIQGFYKTGRPGQSLDVGNFFKLVRVAEQGGKESLTSSPRAAQHLTALDGSEFDLILPTDARIGIPPKATSAGSVCKTISLQTARHQTVGSQEVRVCRPRSEDKVRIAGLNASFKFKDLMQKWKIPARDRSEFLVTVSEDGLKTLYVPESMSSHVTEMRMEFLNG